jgi:SAM-dependent methyltransferase
MHGWPVIVDFEQSVIRHEGLASSAGERGAPAAQRWSIGRLPRRLRGVFDPPNRVAERNTAALLSLLTEPAPLILVVGGGTIGNGVAALYADQRVRLVGFDIYASPWTQFIADAHQIPLLAESVDAVVVQAVLEHVVDPNRVVAEIRRVLRPRGLVYAETPFLQQVHAGAYDFTRYTSSGHRYLFRSFDEIAAGPVAGAATGLLWSIDHVIRGLLRSELAGKLARGFFFWLRYLDPIVSDPFAADSASAYFFLGRRSDHELTPREAVDYYRGAQRGP